jgi:tRNA-uridine 2-sulfurtransferase
MSMRIVVGLSGGVDSAVSAALLRRTGADVVGAFIKTWTPEWLENKCNWREERRDAMRVAAHLGIPFITVDLEKEYKKGVADYMIAEYKVGRTPNPDVMCNKEVKFGAFLRKAMEFGADAIATGHYARIVQNSKGKTQNYSSKLLRGVDEKKDQSYFLWTLTQLQLAKVIFPVGHLMKSEVRELAKKFKLPVAEKRDSQGICFLGHVDMREFLAHYIAQKKGEVIDEQGITVGEHEGAIFYTLGQRVLGQYVVAKDIEKNVLIVAPEANKLTSQQANKLSLRDINWIDPACKLRIANCKIPELVAQVRYHGEMISCALVGDTVTLAKPILAASGQSVVFYSSNICLGGGVVQ